MIEWTWMAMSNLALLLPWLNHPVRTDHPETCHTKPLRLIGLSSQSQSQKPLHPTITDAGTISLIYLKLEILASSSPSFVCQLRSTRRRFRLRLTAVAMAWCPSLLCGKYSCVLQTWTICHGWRVCKEIWTWVYRVAYGSLLICVPLTWTSHLCMHSFF